MADSVEIDLYADDLEQEFAPDEFINDGIDLYDDVITDPSSIQKSAAESNMPVNNSNNRSESSSSNHTSLQYSSTHTGRRYQLYVGNLTWWTTDQDITDAIMGLGIQDFIEVKFFENRSNGRSKGFCLVSVGSEQSMRICLERLPKKELHGQTPAVTHATKQALNKFEAQIDRPNPPANNQSSQRLQHPGVAAMSGIRVTARVPPQIRNRTPPPGMQPVPPRMPPVPHMGGPPVPPHGGPPNQQHPFPNTWQNGLRQNGPPRPPGPPQPLPQQRPGGPPPGMFQGPPPPGQGPPPRGPPPGISGPLPDQRGAPPRPDWTRPPGMQGPGFIHQQIPGMQGPPTGQGPPNRGPPPNMGGVPLPQGGSTSHINPSFFPQGGGGPPMQQTHIGPPQVPPQGPQGPPQGPPQNPHGPPIAPPLEYGPPPQQRMHPFVSGITPQEHRTETPSLTEAEFEEIMARNRTVSSSAIARAVSDAAAGEYANAIETLVTAISLIKQSKAANDDRCKILISSLQDTLHGVETKSYGSARRERSRSRDRDRTHRRSRRERSRSRERDYRERSRERDRDRERERDREKERYYTDTYPRERSRSRERERDREYRERSREDSRYYEDRYRERERDRDRDRDRDRERERETARREPERERERDRDRDRERERAESSHRSSRH